MFNEQLDSPLDQFGDFFAQLPTSLYIMVCGGGLLLFLAILYFAAIKPRLKKRRQQRENATPQTSTPPVELPDDLIEATAPIPNPEPRNFMDDMNDPNMPDLDLLTDTSTLEKALPDVKVPPPKPATTKPAPATSSAPAPIPERRKKGRYRVKMDNGAMIPADEVMTILRDPRDNRLVVQINNAAYRSLIDAGKTREQVIKILKEVADVVKTPDDNPPSPEEFKMAPSAPPIDEKGTMPGDLPTYDLDDALRPTGRGKYEATPVPELNIAAAIEAYLQYNLQFAPEFSDRSLHVRSSPSGGVRIQVDNVSYDAVDDIEEDDIREFLRATIQEWQDRQ